MVLGAVAVIAAIISAVICGFAGGFGSLAWLWMLPVGWLGTFLGVLLLAFLMVLVMCAFVDIEKEETEDNALYRRVIYMIADGGGYDNFTFDITSFLEEENELVIRVQDDLRDQTFPYGKQTLKRGGMWYTPVSGIWQTVWLESVPETYIENLDIQVDLTKATPTASGMSGVKIAKDGDFVELKIPMKSFGFTLHNYTETINMKLELSNAVGASGFYGVLRPFDGVTPYRLEMQAKASVGGFKDLYEYWGDSLYQELTSDGDHVILNLASKEYSKCIEKYLTSEDTYITCVFGEVVDGKVVYSANEMV